jgi:hypothetical protein
MTRLQPTEARRCQDTASEVANGYFACIAFPQQFGGAAFAATDFSFPQPHL